MVRYSDSKIISFPGVQAGNRAQFIVLTSLQGPNAMDDVVARMLSNGTQG